MNRCIQCTRCVRFTQEISRTGEIGFFQRGARAEIGTFPAGARQPALDLRGGPLPGRRPDLDPLPLRGARLVPRQEALDLHRLRRRLQHHARASPGAIKRYKPRLNPDVNDYWMCDHGRGTHERYREVPRWWHP